MSSSVFQWTKKRQRNKMINLTEQSPVTSEATTFSEININAIDTKASYLVMQDDSDKKTCSDIDVDKIIKNESYLGQNMASPIKRSLQSNDRLHDNDLKSIRTDASFLDANELPDDFHGTPITPGESVKLETTDSEELIIDENFTDVGDHLRKPQETVNDIILISDDEDESVNGIDLKIKVYNLEQGIKIDQPISHVELSSAVEKHRLAESANLTENVIEEKVYQDVVKALEYIKIKSNVQAYQLEHTKATVSSPEKLSSPMKRKLEEEDKENNNFYTKCIKSDANLSIDTKKMEKSPVRSKILTLGDFKKMPPILPTTSKSSKSFDLIPPVDTKELKDFSRDDSVIELNEDLGQTKKEIEAPLKSLRNFVVNYHDFSRVPHFIDMVKDLKHKPVMNVRANIVIHDATEQYECSDSVYINEPPDNEFHPAIVCQSDRFPVAKANGGNGKIHIISDTLIIPEKNLNDFNASFNSRETLDGIMRLQQRRSENTATIECSEPINIDLQMFGDSIKKLEKQMPYNYLRKDPRLQHVNKSKLIKNHILPAVSADPQSDLILNKSESMKLIANQNRRHSVPTLPRDQKDCLLSSPVLLRRYSSENQTPRHKEPHPGKWKKDQIHSRSDRPYRRRYAIDNSQPSTSKGNLLARPANNVDTIKEISKIEPPNQFHLNSVNNEPSTSKATFSRQRATSVNMDVFNEFSSIESPKQPSSSIVNNQPSTSKTIPLARPVASGSKTNVITEFSKIESPHQSPENPQFSPVRSPDYHYVDQTKRHPECRSKGKEHEDDVDVVSRHIAYYIYMFEILSTAQNKFREIAKNVPFQSVVLFEELRLYRKFFRDRNLKQSTALIRQMDKLNIASKFLNYKEFLDQVLYHCKHSYKLADISTAKMTKILINTFTHNDFTFRELNDFTRGLINHLKYMVQQMPLAGDPFQDRYCVCSQPAQVLCNKCKCATYCLDGCQQYFVECHETYCFS